MADSTHPGLLTNIEPEHLEELVVSLMGEMVFADAWKIPREVSEPRGDVSMQAPVHLPFKGEMQVGVDRACLHDLVAGYYSVPDDHVDESLCQEFLAEWLYALVREISEAHGEECTVELGDFEVGSPLRLDAAGWTLALDMGVNESGRLRLRIRI